MHLSDCTSVEHAEPLRALGQELVQWFAVHKRTLPWREDRSPYRVWLSEIMLQQTRVATVVPYYERFLARFPEVASLAAAAEDEVLGLWSGLGYYSRGRNLHRAAQVVMDQWGGEFPSTAAELRTLPGVGPYTAAAIASLAFGRMEGVVDGNVLRVLSRLFDDESPVGTPHSHATAQSRVEGLIGATGDPAGVNEGLMELGALVCTPRSPACGKCPWQARCLAYAKSTVPLRPVKLPKRARTSLRIVCAVVYDEEWVWLEKRPAGGLFGGLHEPPSSPLRGRTTADAAVIRLLQERGLPLPQALPAPFLVARALTHRDLVIEAYPLAVSRRELQSPVEGFRHGTSLHEVGISSAVRAALLSAWPLAERFLGATKDSPVP